MRFPRGGFRCSLPREMVHPTAIIHPDARLHPSVQVGAYSVIDAGVTIGADSVLAPHVYITGQTTIGARNRFYSGAVIGEAPQDFKYKGEPTGLQIGDGNLFREHVTVHRSNSLTENTVIGSGNFLMAGAHIGHNSQVGSRSIIANGALLGGHVQIADGAFISGTCLLHQFVRVGTLAMMRGGSGISKDLPPFAIARGENYMCGLNFIGMRRAGIGSEERLEVRRLYHFLFRSGRKLREGIEAARQEFKSPSSTTMIEFVAQTKRGICAATLQTADLDEDLTA
jgi:UDP-N-acetylglucosamine acyltransferase